MTGFVGLFFTMLLIAQGSTGQDGGSSIKTKTGTIHGEIQGVVVARRPLRDDQFDLAVMDGSAIRSIDERGIHTTRIVWESVAPWPGIKLPPDSRIADNMKGRQVASDINVVQRFTVIGELVPGKAGTQPTISPVIRIKSQGSERKVRVDDIVPRASISTAQ